MSVSEKQSLRRRYGILLLLAALLFAVVIGVTLHQTAPGKTVAQWHSENPTATVTKQININTATEEELLQLEEITARQARSIVEYRSRFVRFTSVEELSSVSGISKTDVARWAPYLTTH